MSEYERLVGLLPSLYRPEPDEDSLVNRLLLGWGFVLDSAAVQVQHVLRSHWFDTADHALWDAHYQREREERGLLVANVRAAKDFQEVQKYPYVTDLARVASLLDLPPWLEPIAYREGVEEYRGRVSDLVDAYRLGLTTLPALRRLTEAALPEDETAPLAEQRFPFAIEEPVALRTWRVPIVTPDALEGDAIGPLFRFSLENVAAPPVVYLQGAASAPTERPALEDFTPGQVPAGVALGYRGSLAPGETLRLSPGRRTWVAVDGALQVSSTLTLANEAADPSSNGPFAAVTGAPPGRIVALAESLDRSLWLVTEDAGASSLSRYDGQSFESVGTGAPSGRYLALAARRAHVYVGTDVGLFKCGLFPDEGQSFALSAVAAVTQAVRALSVLGDGRLACATSDGIVLLDLDDAIVEQPLTGVGVEAFSFEVDRLYVATATALLLSSGGAWFKYEGAALAEDQPDWVRLEVSELAGAESPLPRVRSLSCTRDGGLWIGTERGLARWGVRGDRTTLLEAYPDLGSGPIETLCVDERGMLWIGGADGLFRYDGRDLAQYRFSEKRWASLGNAAFAYPDEISSEARGHFRFAQAESRWERFFPEIGRFRASELEERVSASAPGGPVLHTATLRAELGTLNGNDFTPSSSVGLEQFVTRVKPDESRIVEGGLPALPTGKGLLRYLEVEAPDLVPPAGRPWWSREGRLFLPPVVDAPWPGHFRGDASVWQADGHFNQAIFAYPPSARVWFEYAAKPSIGVRVRLFKRAPEQTIDPLLIERVWQLLIRAKAASVPLELMVEGAIVKGS